MPGYYQQPYIYSAPAQYDALNPYNGFDPKAYTRASYIASLPKPKPKGPLIDFNKHPDSWMVPPEKTKQKPMDMSPNTKRNIVYVRWFQLFLRICTMLGALGCLACTIMTQNTSATEAPLIRIPPCMDIITTAYALIHLLSPVKRRPPASAASYHFFALVIDAGLVPFYAFIATLTRSNMDESITNSNRWISMMKTPSTTNKILLSLWLVCITLVALHLATFFISLWLVWMFRRISNLPPDMNPLEENLTSRKKMKHKHKNSELTLDNFPDPSAKKLSMYYIPKTAPKKEMSTTDQSMSFFATRANPNGDYSAPYSPVANGSGTDLPTPPATSIYQQPRSVQTSRINLNSDLDKRSDISKPDSRLSHHFMSEPSSHLPTLNGSALSDPLAPPVPRKSSRRHTLTPSNWVICTDSDAPAHHEADLAVSIVDSNPDFAPSTASNSIQSSTGGFDLHGLPHDDAPPRRSLASTRTAYPGLPLKPLGMNPPTPPPPSTRNGRPARRPHSDQPAAAPPRPLSTATGNATAAVAVPARKCYGDLGSAVQAIRPASPSPSPSPSPPRRQQRAGVAKRDWAFSPGTSARVVSATGAEWEDVRLDAKEGDLGLRGRNVSGKVAEEGRGGVWWMR